MSTKYWNIATWLLSCGIVFATMIKNGATLDQVEAAE